MMRLVLSVLLALTILAATTVPAQATTSVTEMLNSGSDVAYHFWNGRNVYPPAGNDYSQPYNLYPNMYVEPDPCFYASGNLNSKDIKLGCAYRSPSAGGRWTIQIQLAMIYHASFENKPNFHDREEVCNVIVHEFGHASSLRFTGLYAPFHSETGIMSPGGWETAYDCTVWAKYERDHD